MIGTILVIVVILLILAIVVVYITKIKPFYGQTIQMYFNPVTATNLQLINVTQNSMTLTWDLDAGFHEIIWWSPTQTYTTGTLYNTNAYTFTGLVPNTSYNFEITTKGLLKTVTSYVIGTFTPSPFAPTYKLGTNSITLYWYAIPLAVTYVISGVDVVPNITLASATVTSTSYTFNNLVPGDIYKFTITALNSAGNVLGAVNITLPLTSFNGPSINST